MSHGIVKQVEQAYLKKDLPQFQVGEEFIFFLELIPDTQRYRLVMGPQAVFKNFGGVVEQVGRGRYKERGRVPLGLFIKELNDAAKQGRGQGRGNK